MTTIYQRIISVLLVLLFGAQLFYTGMQTKTQSVELQEEKPIRIWYTDPDIQSYMDAAAEETASRYGVEVFAELVSEVDYIEKINKQSVAEEMTGPDVYVVSSALLEKATLAGLTAPVKDTEPEKTYSEKAVQAVTYDGTVVARPFYIETCFLIYNQQYVDPEEVPDTIDDILMYAENFEAGEGTEQVENIFKWNVADVIDNYMFLGAYTDLGGPSGDDKELVKIDLEKAEECMDYFQSLNSFFAIDADTVTSEAVIQEFIDGKTVFSLINVPMLAELDRAVDASFYQVAELPALTEELDTRGLSTTNSVVVNPYSSNRAAAEACARYLTQGRAGQLYEEAGKLPACRDLPQEPGEAYQKVYEVYEQAAEVPKIMELSNIWLHLEVVLADIWRGADAGEELAAFSELLAQQLD
ncbi:MAG: extracellular solute-binding protein [Clostridiales bacterium]|nr:extracellular solute-binding protein [Clostridiales bacterium]